MGLLVAGYSEVSPQSAIASALLDRLTAIIQGPLGLVAHYRDTSPQLAAWLAKELIERTTVEITSTNYLPTRPQGARR
ncbi:hypothetical protein [Aeromicrobium choanae]|uniref:hypothetical protein n=1 Tax=Aeromicrobium choanae TaxID=1736691 RepID=UPI0012947D3B|nr:hypothetical protein [Aeromicrobium choanae]